MSGRRTLHDAQAAREPSRQYNVRTSLRAVELTWVPRTAIGTQIVSGYALDQILEDFLVARLLAFAQRSGHVEA
jgi:hypothetical protein